MNRLILFLLGIIILAPVLLFTVRDKRVITSSLNSQRLPRYLRWFDVSDLKDKVYGLNGDLSHQTKHLLGSDHSHMRESVLINALIIIYDRECEGKGIPWYKLWWMRYSWLAFKKYWKKA